MAAYSDLETTQTQITFVCELVRNLLLSKNEKYGNAALDPIRIFSKANTVEQLLVRIDDKLNRIKFGAGLLATDEDTLLDLIGYLILLKIALKSSNEYTGSTGTN